MGKAIEVNGLQVQASMIYQHMESDGTMSPYLITGPGAGGGFYVVSRVTVHADGSLTLSPIPGTHPAHYYELANAVQFVRSLPDGWRMASVAPHGWESVTA